MRTFLRAHWKAIVAIVLLVLLAMVTMSPSSAPLAEPSLSARLRTHVAALGAVASGRFDNPEPQGLERAAAYIAQVLESEGYRVRRRPHAIEVSVANPAAGSRPARLFVIGARYDAVEDSDDKGSGSAAVLELARLLKGLHPSAGTEVKFVFSASGAERGESGSGGSFIAFVGTPAASSRVQDALSAFQAASAAPARGLAAPAYVQGVTLSARRNGGLAGDPAVVITESAFRRYPYRRAVQGMQEAQDAQDSADDDGVARVVAGVANTITALAAARQM
jgi:hypothetical protein